MGKLQSFEFWQKIALSYKVDEKGTYLDIHSWDCCGLDIWPTEIVHTQQELIFLGEVGEVRRGIPPADGS